MSGCHRITEKTLAMLLSKLKQLEVVEAVATNIGVVPESELSCRIMLHGCPLVSPPIMHCRAVMDIVHKKAQNPAKMPEDSLTTKNNQYFKGYSFVAASLCLVIVCLCICIKLSHFGSAVLSV